jgi:putative hydrolase
MNGLGKDALRTDALGTRLTPRSSPARRSRTPPTGNQAIADRLREAADLIEATQGEVFRVAAYRKAADSVLHLDRDLREIARGGRDALEAIPGVGRSISRTIMQLLETGRWPYLEQLRGSADPVRLLCTVPGVGPVLAERIADTLHVSTLEQLELAAERGELAAVPGLGPRRIRMLRATVNAMLSRIRRPDRRPDLEPPVSMLLDVDREYRAQSDVLPKLAPRRFNPGGVPWLPVLHTRRGEWMFTALYSNSARAHERGKQHDWVVISFGLHGGADGQRTVVTETHGALMGRRVVRGREGECAAHEASTRGTLAAPAAIARPSYGPPPLEKEPPPEARLGPHSPGAVTESRSDR